MLNEKRQKKTDVLNAVYISPLESGLNRREFLRQTGAAALLMGLMSCKPAHLKISGNQQLTELSTHHKSVLDAVTMQLFPDDGNGPSARDVNALSYLQWALQDPDNIEDGDNEFIIKGIGWLEDLSTQTQSDSFAKLSNEQQSKILNQIAEFNAGENWLSLLIYYLMEALLLDPVYGGNPNSVGWQWLEHQAGFPRPPTNKTYQFLS